MGEVYRSRDTRLGRDVAVKVLSRHLSDRVEVRARFEREAKTVSSLNHPHICTLYDVGREGETDYLVMELVEGETLAERINRGALPASDVLRLGAQIADALDRAHRAGVVHRDLKPANVMLAKSGVKLMDFGLARAVGLTGPTDSSTQETLTQKPLTEEGTIVGTFQYMPPEQLEGGESDTRSDIWALGCVLYEMATGKRAFEGASRASLIASILKEDPRPLAELVPMTPPALDRAVRQCLAKDPDERWQTASDLRRELQWIAEPGSSQGASAQAATPSKRRSSAPVAWGLTVVIAALLVTQWMRQGPTPPRDAGTPERYVVAKAEFTRLSSFDILPDGSSIVFSVSKGQSRRVYRRDLSSLEMTAIPGTEDGYFPFFSPDGAWIGFMTKDAIKKVPVDGGPSQVIHAERRLQGGDWGSDGNIYYATASGGADGMIALSRVPAAGGVAEVIATLDTTAGETASYAPEVLPDGKTVLLSIYGSDPDWKIIAVRAGEERRVVVENALLCRYVPGGRLLYADAQSLAVLAVPFDAASARVTGPAVPLTEPTDPMFLFAAAGEDKLVYVPAAGSGPGDEIAWLDRTGVGPPAMNVQADWTQPRVSPDGSRLLARKVGTLCEIWMLDIQRGSLVEIAHGRDNEEAVWSPDGRRIAYYEADTPQRMLTRTVDGALRVTPLLRGAEAGEPQSWSDGGNLLVYSMRDPRTLSDIWVLPMDGASQPVRFLATEADELAPSISTDGRWIAYSSDESGTAEVYIRPYPDTGEVWQVSAGGGISPLWSRDGRELFFISGTSMMAVPVQTQPTLNLGVPVPLFDGGFSTSRLREYDIAPDGRFVVVRRAGGDAGLPELRMLLNWGQEMRRLAGGPK